MKPLSSATLEAAYRYAQALKRFERTGRMGNLVALFSEEAELSNEQSLSHVHGIAGVYRHWRDYSSSFEKIETAFAPIQECGELAILSWTSDAKLNSGETIRFEGVTLLTFRNERITQLRSYSNLSACLEVHATRRAA